MSNKKFVTFGIVLLFMGAALPAHADEVTLSVTGNGQASTNTASATTQSDTTVQQNNTADVTNNTTTQADTGNNSASNNTGNASVDTGDSNAQTTTTNTDINTNIANAGTNPQTSTQTIIANNGENSINTSTTTVTTTTSVQQNNTAHITNTVTTHADTGHNSASHNNGNVSIETGDITANTIVTNSNINNSIAKTTSCNCSLISSTNTIVIKGNGQGSVNNVFFNLNHTTNFTSNNLADIFNFINHELNTGGNTADHNNGDVAIKTGNVDSSITVNNDHINSNYDEKDCGCKPTPPPPPPPPNGGNGGNNPGSTPTVGSSSGTGGSSSNSSSGPSLGQVLGAILPATGSLFLLWATIASLILFFSGWYLRFRSGCAPNAVV